MYGMHVTKRRFSLYNLDEGEMYIKDFVAKVKYFIPSKQKYEELQGIVYVCSRSLIFESDDISFNLVKFSFKEISELPYVIPEKGNLKSTLNFNSNRIVDISGFTEPYKLVKLAPGQNEVSIEFVFEKCAHVAKIINELIDKYNSKQSFFEFDSVEYLGSIYSFQFDLTSIKSVNEKFVIEKDLYVKQLLPLIEVPGLVKITDQRLYFQPLFKVDSKKCISVKYSKVTELYKRKVHLQNVGIEIITPKKRLLFKFENEQFRNNVFTVIGSYTQISCETNISIEKYTHKWIKGEMSNYDYLLKLNSAANRTRNDLAQYPVFPWVITNYTSDTLDLKDPKNYRDLSLPIGAINPKRLEDFMKRYQEMPPPKFIYGTHYSNPAYVIGYLTRKYPEYMLKLHGGKFDNPDRLFASIEIDWNICYTNPGSLKELIPEFFESNTDFLLNNKKIDLGVNAKGEKINNVILPPWADSPSNFLEIMREALESDYVNENLHNWIDLIFGYKQTGEEAVKAKNLFHPVSYETGDNFAQLDESEIRMIQLQATEFGQCPKKLFTKPHPKKFSKIENDIAELEFNVDKLQLVHHEDEHGNALPAIHFNETVEIDFEKLEMKKFSKHHKCDITSSGLLNETKLLATGSSDGFVKIYDLKSGGVKRMIQISNLSITSMAEINEQNLLVLGSANNKVYILNTALGKPSNSFEAHEDSIISLFYSSETNRLITDGADSTYKLWDLSTKVPVHVYYDTETQIKSGDYQPRESLHVCIDEDGNLILRKMNKENEVTKLKVDPCEEFLVRFDNVNDNQFFLCNDSKFDIYDIRMNSVVSSTSDLSSLVGVTNDSKKGLYTMKEKIVLGNLLDYSSSSIVKEWNIEDISHFNYMNKKDSNVFIIGNENGDIYYSEINKI